MGRNADSRYLITRIFSIKYFHYYSTPAFFSAYFFPFIAVGKARAYFDDEIDEKISNVRNNLHGNFYNYATQGFGNVAFDRNQISFSYFYERLIKYETEKNKYFDKIDGIDELESESTKKEIYDVINRDNLMLKRNIAVKEEIKKELISDLQNKGAKYTLARMLYYIVDDKHILPDVDSNYYENIIRKLNLHSGKPNVYMTFRKEMDVDLRNLNKLLLDAREVQLLCRDGISLFGNNMAYKECESKDEILINALLHNEKINIEIVLQSSDEDSVDEVNVNLKHLRISKLNLADYSINRIKKVMHDLYGSRVFVKKTKQKLPYALMLFKFEDELLDFVKLDLYSPFIADNSERPSMYILRKSNYKMFEHFQEVFDHVWNDERYSQFI